MSLIASIHLETGVPSIIASGSRILSAETSNVSIAPSFIALDNSISP